MQCANCREEGRPAYTLRAHVERDGESGGQDEAESSARTDGGEAATIDLRFCSLVCLRAWT
ncbi:hypothetical protein [Halosimplex salinum]|uniref:hypothetical protein n=1 Tax=Halosimplex salinum TaxID=1710538 RepID=UPI000F4942F0|nr:hypothetical protein [Halosimplex salinum]